MSKLRSHLVQRCLVISRKHDLELVAVILITIVGTYLFSYTAFVVIQNKFPTSLLSIWDRWDTTPYLNLAQGWYTNSTVENKHLAIAFFPGYPVMIKFFALFLKNYMLAALVVSNISYVFACYYLYRIMIMEAGREDAFRSVIYLSIFPTAYFLHAAYSESLFLALTISSFFYARKNEWAISSILCMLATATRITGILLIPPLIIEYLYQRNFKLKNFERDMLWLVITPLGFVSYLIINYMTFEDPFKFLHFQREHWAETMTFPWEGFMGAWGSFKWRPPTDSIVLGISQAFIAVVGLFICIYSWFRVRLSYSLYMCISFLILTSASFWLSLPRFTLSIFPLFISLSLLGRNKVINFLIIFLSLLLYSLYSSLFIQGRWAY